jgi:hypothetical protein
VRPCNEVTGAGMVGHKIVDPVRLLVAGPRRLSAGPSIEPIFASGRAGCKHEGLAQFEAVNSCSLSP